MYIYVRAIIYIVKLPTKNLLTPFVLFIRFIMAELLQTERAYVKDLDTCISCYLREMRNDPGSVPPALQGKVYKICYSKIRSFLSYSTRSAYRGELFIQTTFYIKYFFISFGYLRFFNALMQIKLEK